MGSYIGKVQIGSVQYALGSTLYGTCNTEATTGLKQVVLADLNALIKGVTVYIKFTRGNRVSDNVQLYFTDVENGEVKIGSISVVGLCTCNANEILAFTYEQDGSGNSVTTCWRTHTCGGVLTQESLDNALAQLAPMKFKGVLQTLPSPTAVGYGVGDVIVVDSKEYVLTEVNNTKQWEEFGDDTLYLKHSDVDNATITLYSLAEATVVNGVLTLPSPSQTTQTVLTPASN